LWAYGHELAILIAREWNAGVLAGWPAGVLACAPKRRRDAAGPAAGTAAFHQLERGTVERAVSTHRGKLARCRHPRDPRCMSAVEPGGTTSAYDIRVTTGTLMTADELFHLPDDGWRYELVRGELRKMSPAGADHGSVGAEIIASLVAHVKKHRLGKVYNSDTGFRISRDPDTIRAPDAAFVRAARAVATHRFFEGPPDVAFEVVSPNDRYTEIEEKTRDWLRAGVLAVVIVDPGAKSARVERRGGGAPVAEVIEIEDVLPGWKLPLAELFD
jgi:Uma2 family endonuclease